jgi:hypothetical protein
MLSGESSTELLGRIFDKGIISQGAETWLGFLSA